MDEDNRPLLDNEEIHERLTPALQIKELFKSHQTHKVSETSRDITDEILSGDQINITASNSLNDLKPDPPDDVVAVFVVAFDTRSGNIVQWCLPEETDLESVEFKSMPSGAHTVDSDFLYFRKGNLYGLSCFEKMTVDSKEERGVRMKSVGVLTSSYSTLHRYIKFLELQVRHQLQTPCDYEQLTAFYEDKKGILPSTPCDNNVSVIVSSLTETTSLYDFPEMHVTHPVGCFPQFIRFFSKNIFILWKLTLLQKRILFFSPPPIGVVCYRVYCTSCLARHNFMRRTRKMIKPYFYVNIADIEKLENEMCYVACTTEKIFEEKKHLYDVYIDNRILKSNSPALKDVLKINRCDEEKYQQLLNCRQEHIFFERIGEAEHPNEEHMFASFFIEQNNRLFQTLFDVAASDDRTLTSEHIRAMGLDPVADHQFIMMILDLYEIDILMVVDNPCCPV